MVIVSLAAATICFSGICYPALIGKTTPTGEYQLQQRLTEQPGYGGDVLQFTEDKTSWTGIHRVYLLNPKQKRAERLKSTSIADRVITDGCINVDPEVYKKLVDCCSTDKIIIR